MTHATADGAALLAAIISDPGDDTVRLAYADYLEEHGDGERAEFVRLQCRMVALLGRFPCICERGWVCPACEGDHELMSAVAREDELFRASKAWVATEWDHVYLPVRKWTAARTYPTPSVFLDRGFISAVHCAAADWLKHADSLHWHPSQTERCPQCEASALPPAVWVPNGTPEGEWDTCSMCGGTGMVRRPCPPTAQPITRVTLTTRPAVTELRVLVRDNIVTPSTATFVLRHSAKDVLERCFPGVVFETPPVP